MDDDDLLPARMVNEYVYCPRLFYLEWVQARFVDNDDTRLGQQVHRRVVCGLLRPKSSTSRWRPDEEAGEV